MKEDKDGQVAGTQTMALGTHRGGRGESWYPHIKYLLSLEVKHCLAFSDRKSIR